MFYDPIIRVIIDVVVPMIVVFIVNWHRMILIVIVGMFVIIRLSYLKSLYGLNSLGEVGDLIRKVGHLSAHEL
jgi:c-di-AMP phosphodiesterase-like protein